MQHTHLVASLEVDKKNSIIFIFENYLSIVNSIHICRWAGLQRGAIAVALVYYYFDPRGMADDSHRSTIIATTLILVLFSTVVFSAATKPLMEFMLGAGNYIQEHNNSSSILLLNM